MVELAGRVCKRGHACFVGGKCKPCASIYRRERRAADPEFRERTAAHARRSAKKRAEEDPVIAAKQRAAIKTCYERRMLDPANREKARELTRLRRADPAYAARERERALESDRKRNQDPQFVARKLAYMKERFQRPMVREMHRRNENQRRSRLAGACSSGVTAAEWLAICSQHVSENGDTVCFYCGAACAVTVDHVVPIARGGRDEPDNVVPACKRCNSGKRDRLPHEWHRARVLLGDRYESFVQRVLNYR